ncbi:hypothetical protein BT63DRAFT_415682 [Microthyrium microscopicum]|uniref:Sialidase domain-containing protein n=1 Tax=Microthyrium microscopicum TaxID=703497 RepID=A0A6A6U4J1_9PEZI|nr:hypothetical protein BT63DRAFT_415682 [Microthyrium microscopicum]
MKNGYLFCDILLDIHQYPLSQTEKLVVSTRLYQPPSGKSAGAPQIANLSGKLVGIFRTNAFHGSGPNHENGDGVVMISEDYGASWTDPMIVGPAPSNWPGVFAIDTDRFLTLYSRDDSTAGWDGGPLSQAYSLN